MTNDSVITLIGTIVTILATAISIHQATQVKNYREQIKFDVRKINLSNCAERLRRAQDDIRRLPLDFNQIPRGFKIDEIMSNIKSHFDYSIGMISDTGPDSDIREILTNAQRKMNDYEIQVKNRAIEPTSAHDLQSLIQDSISRSNARIYELEGKA